MARFLIKNALVGTIGATFLGGLVMLAGCFADDGGGGGGGAGGSCVSDLNIYGAIVRDARDGTVRDSAFVTLNDGIELPTGCEATVVLVVGTSRTTLEETQQGQYEAGYSEVYPNLPPLTLEAGGVHELEVDLGSDGVVDATGEVILSDIDSFRTTMSTSSEVRFAWNDAGVVGDTVYSVQASDEADFLFPDNFATGMSEGQTNIAFGGSSPWPYFSASGPLYARIQAETWGTLSVPGRFTAMDWPLEPILQY